MLAFSWPTSKQSITFNYGLLYVYSQLIDADWFIQSLKINSTKNSDSVRF